MFETLAIHDPAATERSDAISTARTQLETYEVALNGIESAGMEAPADMLNLVDSLRARVRVLQAQTDAVTNRLVFAWQDAQDEALHGVIECITTDEDDKPRHTFYKAVSREGEVVSFRMPSSYGPRLANGARSGIVEALSMEHAGRPGATYRWEAE